MYASQVDQIFAQFGIEDAYKADFIKGFQSSFKINPNDQKANAQAIGEALGHQMGTQFVPYLNKELFGSDSTKTMSKSNFLAGYLGSIQNGDSSTLMTMQEAQAYGMGAIEQIKKENYEKEFAEAKKENADFLEKNKSAEGVITTPSGLQYKVIKEGNGPKPAETDRVKVDYHGTNIKGEVFDSSVNRGEPATFGLNQVIKGWTEGLQLMPVGSKYIFYIPYDLAYGEQSRNEFIGPYATLIFEVELHGIEK